MRSFKRNDALSKLGHKQSKDGSPGLEKRRARSSPSHNMPPKAKSGVASFPLHCRPEGGTWQEVCQGRACREGHVKRGVSRGLLFCIAPESQDSATCNLAGLHTARNSTWQARLSMHESPNVSGTCLGRVSILGSVWKHCCAKALKKQGICSVPGKCHGFL